MPPLREEVLPPANRIFVDREQPQRIFDNAAFAIPSDGAILRVFYGVGGQGKTALCQELMRKTDANFDQSFSFLRRCLLDLHGKPKDDPDLLLVWIRNGFAKAGVFMPCFDLALALMWEGSRREQPFPNLVNPWLGRSSQIAEAAVDESAGSASGYAAGLIEDLINDFPGLAFLYRRIGKWVIDKSKKAYLAHTRDHLQKMHKEGDLRPAFELSRLLPWMLAQDLNYHLTEQPDDRFALFIDEYERVFDQAGAGAQWVENPFDCHMRDFIKETNGLLAVFFSREPLPWAKDAEWNVDLDQNQHPIDGLEDKDADLFLKTIPIDDESIRTAIINGARETSANDALVYPLMLDLQVEHWRNLMAKGAVKPEYFTVSASTFQSRCTEILGCVLRDYDLGLQATIERLSVARQFDQASFEFVVTTFGTTVPFDSFDRISEMSFVARSEGGFFRLHNVIASALREILDDERRLKTIEALFDHFNSRAKVVSHDHLNAEKVAALFEASYLRQTYDTVGYVLWLGQATKPLQDARLDEKNAALWQEALAISEQKLGLEHIATATCLNNVAMSLRHKADYVGAKSLSGRALAIVEKEYGPEDPLTGKSLGNHAAVLRDIGEYDRARLLLKRAALIAEKEYGTTDLLTATCHGNLALLLRDMGKFAEAVPHSERALGISETVNGPSHPKTAYYLNILGSLLHAEEEFKEAKRLMQRALEITANAFGPMHFATGDCYHHMGCLYKDMGDYANARSYLEQGLEIREKTNEPNHLKVCMSLQNLAEVIYEETGDWERVKLLLDRALDISEKAGGSAHPISIRIQSTLKKLRLW